MSTPPLRLFFALPCPEEIRAPLAAWRDGLAIDGQPVAAANLHLTWRGFCALAPLSR